MKARNIDRLTRVYSPENWALYERLDKSLSPSSPDRLLELAGDLIEDQATILDVGCRDAAHLIRLVAASRGVNGVGVDPVAIHIERAVANVQAAGLSARIQLHECGMHALPHPDEHFDFVWCRDVLEQVDPLAPALVEVARVMKPGARLLVFTTVATDLLEPREDELLRRHLGNVRNNLDQDNVEHAFGQAGLEVERYEAIGTEWREYAEERTQPVSKKLLHLARLRRQRAELTADFGQSAYEHVEANLHWELFQFLGKLLPVVYILRKVL